MVQKAKKDVRLVMTLDPLCCLYSIEKGSLLNTLTKINYLQGRIEGCAKSKK